jgi:LPXTG-motif cell wall-anchored protein
MFWTVAIGLLAGLIVRAITPGRKEASGFLIASILGVVGAFIGPYLAQEGGWIDAGSNAGLAAAIIGALVLLAIWAFLFRRRSSSWM